MTRAPNPITHGMALPINSMSVITGLFEYAFVVLTAIILAKERKMRVSPKESFRKTIIKSRYTNTRVWSITSAHQFLL